MIPVLLNSSGGSESPWVHRRHCNVIRASGLQKGDMLLVTAVLEDGDNWRLTIYEDCEYEFEAEVIKLKVKHDAYGEDSLVSVDLINGAKESR